MPCVSLSWVCVSKSVDSCRKARDVASQQFGGSRQNELLFLILQFEEIMMT